MSADRKRGTGRSSARHALVALGLVLPIALPAQARDRDVDPTMLPRPEEIKRDGEQLEVPKTVDNLRDAVLAAYEENPRLLAERSTLRATDEQYVQARAAYGPTLSVQARYGYAHDWIEDLPGHTASYKGYTGTAEVVLTQPLYSGGRRRAAVDLALSQVDLGRESLRYAEVRTIQDVILAYVDVILNRSLLEIAEDNLDVLQRQHDGSRIKFRVREITATDLEQVLSQLQLAQARVETYRGARRVAEGQFLRVVGALPGTLQDLPLLPGLPGTIDEAYSKAENQNPVLLAARARERASRAQLERAKADTRPSISFEGQGSYGPVTPYSNSRNQALTRSQFVLQLPIYSSGLRESRVRQALEQNDADWRLADQAMRDTRQLVSENWNNLIATRSSIGSLRESAAAAQRAFGYAEIQQKAGDRSTQDVLDLARDLLQVRASLASAQADEYRAGAGLLAAMGRLDLANLQPDAPRYDPQAHFTEVRHRGDTPPLTHVVNMVDGVQVKSNKTDRAPRDPAADLRQPGD